MEGQALQSATKTAGKKNGGQACKKNGGQACILNGPDGRTWLQQVLPHALRLDLLDASLFLELSRDPHRLEALVGNRPSESWVVLDEIQKIPALLDEVHRLIESRHWRFALCGSSARKLRRGLPICWQDVH